MSRSAQKMPFESHLLQESSTLKSYIKPYPNVVRTYAGLIDTRQTDFVTHNLRRKGAAELRRAEA